MEHHFTVFVRLPFNRNRFVDPPPVAWSITKERELWDIISRSSKSNEIDWRKLSERFHVTQNFLLQQAAWLYERQLSQVRAQMRRVGGRTSSTASPVPQSTASSQVNAQARTRGSSITSARAPSRTTTLQAGSASTENSSTATGQMKSKSSFPSRTESTAQRPPIRPGTSSRPLSRRGSRDNEASSRTHSRRGSVQAATSKLPAELEPPEASSSEDDPSASKLGSKRISPASGHRRTSSIRKTPHSRQDSIQEQQQLEEETEEEDALAFLPYTDSLVKEPESAELSHDPSATLRGGLIQSTTVPNPRRNVTSPRHAPTISSQPAEQQQSRTESQSSPGLHSQQPTRKGLEPSLNSSASSSDHHSLDAAQRGDRQQTSDLPTPLSPRQQAALAAAAGLSPRRRSTNVHNGSESSPSMGSSFSDLDDASVTQSALEEALMSNMNQLGGTVGTIGNLGSRVSGLSHALRSRYFDARDFSTSRRGGEGADDGNPTET